MALQEPERSFSMVHSDPQEEPSDDEHTHRDETGGSPSDRVDTLGWGLLFVAIGAVSLMPAMPEGAWLVAAGLVMLGASGARAVASGPGRHGRRRHRRPGCRHLHRRRSHDRGRSARPDRPRPDAHRRRAVSSAALDRQPAARMRTRRRSRCPDSSGPDRDAARRDGDTHLRTLAHRSARRTHAASVAMVVLALGFIASASAVSRGSRHCSPGPGCIWPPRRVRE